MERGAVFQHAIADEIDEAVEEALENSESTLRIYELVNKFDNCRAALAYVYMKLTGNEPTPPDDYEGDWHEWLIQEVEKLVEKK